jgi:hypothetical protein
MYENKDPKNGYDVVLPKEWDDTFSFNCTEPMKFILTNSIPGGKWKQKMQIIPDSLRETHEEGEYSQSDGNY